MGNVFGLSETSAGFCGEYDFLSNMYPVDMRFGHIVFPCSESVYQYLKALYISQPLADDVANVSDGYKAKRLLKPHTGKIPEDIKLYSMRCALHHKFKIPEMAEKLLATGDTILVEYNSWGDTFWGVCRGKGKNTLGEMLMQRRKNLFDNIKSVE